MSAAPCSLQWGRDQLIAEMASVRPDLPAKWSLQWGRDQLIAEIIQSIQRPAAVERASMGPRSADRGNRRNGDAASVGSRASMGPRSADRGNRKFELDFQSDFDASMGPRSA